MNMKLSEYLRHIRDFHSHQPSFKITCGLYGCPRSFWKFSSFQSHVYNHHSGDPLVTNQPIFFQSGSPQTPCGTTQFTAANYSGEEECQQTFNAEEEAMHTDGRVVTLDYMGENHILIHRYRGEWRYWRKTTETCSFLYLGDKRETQAHPDCNTGDRWRCN